MENSRLKFRAWDKVAKGWMHDLLASGYSEDGWDNPYEKDEWWAKQGYMQGQFSTFDD